MSFVLILRLLKLTDIYRDLMKFYLCTQKKIWPNMRNVESNIADYDLPIIILSCV